jgi:hypothetical protein
MSIYDEQERRAIFTTYNGVDVEIVKVANSSLLKFVNVNGGVLAAGLDGMFTTPQKAKEALDTYNIQSKINEEKAKALKEAEEAALKELIEAPATKENYAKQRVENIKKETKDKETVNA